MTHAMNGTDKRATLIRARGLTKAYRSGAGDRVVLDSLDIDVAEGEFVVVMGPSGAGKSTLLHVLSAMDAPDSGCVEYRGVKISGLPEKEAAALWADDFGFVFQQSRLVGNLTIDENIRVAGLASSKNNKGKVAAKADLLMGAMGIASVRDNLPDQVSGGEAQRASVARAVINSPAVVFADEPTGALNKANSEDVLDLLADLNSKGQTIVMVTHDHKAALRGTRMLYLCDGEIRGEFDLAAIEGDVLFREQAVLGWLEDLGW